MEYDRVAVRGLSCLVTLVTLLLPDVGRNVNAFNVDLRTAVTHFGEPYTMFGFAVAQHMDQGTPWLLVGAPNASTTQRGVERGGSVLRCRVNVKDDCQPIPFDRKGPARTWSGTEWVAEEQKSHQWFGATLQSAEKTGVIVACAPRYIYFGSSASKREGVGSCYVSQPDTAVFSVYSPCKTGRLPGGHDKLGFCQAGFSIALSDDGNRLIMGAPGSYYWQGQVFSQDLKNSQYNPYETSEEKGGFDFFDYAYMGYASTVGYLTSSTHQAYAVSSPRINDYRGRVTIFEEDLTQVTFVEGDQVGEYFGYALAVSDLNGDGMDDLVVGAPMYTTSYGADTYEIGRVYVFYQDPITHMFDNDTRHIVFGEKRTAARFGSSLAGLGDINNDRVEDVAVGAPYDGEDGRGVVYIFHGSQQGIREKYAQIIYAAEVSPYLKTFGFSLSGGRDMDGNYYPDLLVGAYESDMAVYLRSRPVIEMKVEVISEPSAVKLDETPCKTPSGQDVACYEIIVCLSYSGRGAPSEIDSDSTEVNDLMIHLELEAERSAGSRAYFEITRDTTWTEAVTATRGRSCLVPMKVLLKEEIRDKLAPFGVSLNYTMLESSVQNEDEPRPILDMYIPTVVKNQTEIWMNCGDDNICIPDLRVSAASLSRPYVIGTEDVLEVYVQIRNLADDAHEANVRVKLPPGTSYINVHKIESLQGVKCSTQDENTTNVVICDIGNPLKSGEVSNFVLRISPSRVDGVEEHLRFIIHANSTNPERDETADDNYGVVEIPVRVVVKIQLTGSSRPEQVFFNITDAKNIDNEGDIGPEVIHRYEVHNYGPSDVETVSLIVNWPSYLGSEQARELFYLPELPEITSGPSGVCRAELINQWDIGSSSILSRARRSVEPEMEAKRDFIESVRCEPGVEWCTIIHCETGRIARDDSAIVEIRARIWIQTLIQAGINALIVTSTGTAHVMDVPYNVKPKDYDIDIHDIGTYTAALNVRSEKQPLKIWMIALAISGGVILLFLLIILLWKCGFFNRNKPEDMEELTAVRLKSSASNGLNGEVAPIAPIGKTGGYMGKPSKPGKATPTISKPISPSRPISPKSKGGALYKYDALPTDAY